MPETGGWIDVHHHILPEAYAAALARMGMTTIGGATMPSWSADASLAMMDRNDIRAAALSVSSPGAYSDRPEQAAELARICNDELAMVVAAHPSRFAALAVLPLPHVDASLRLLETLPDSFDGIGLIASHGDKYLGDAAFAPVFDALNRRKAAVFIHPTIGPGSLSFDIGVLPAVVEFTFDTTRTVLSLLRSGTLHRCPDITFILAHNGGTVPFLAGRIESLVERRLPFREFAPEGVAVALRRLHYECTTSTSSATLACMRAFVPASHILFGTDFPFATEQVGAQGMKDVSASEHFTADERMLIRSGNAQRLFPRLRV